MITKLLFEDAAALETPLLAVFAVDTATGKDAAASVTLLTGSEAIKTAAAKVLASGEFKAGVCETVLLHAPAGVTAERLLVIGLGKASKLSLDEVRKGGGTAVRFCKPRGLRDVAIAFPEGEIALSGGLMARVVAEGAELADPDYDTYKSDRKDQSVSSVTMLAAVEDAALTTGFAEGLAIASGQNFTRWLVNEPGNVLTPTEFGKRATAMCAEAGLACEVYSTEKLHELKMGAFWAVSQGSAEPPALIVMTYEPAETPS